MFFHFNILRYNLEKGEILDEKESQLNREEETIPLDRRIRDLAAQLGFSETPEIQALLEPAAEGMDERETIEKYEDKLEVLRQDNPSADFLAAAAILEAAIHIQAGNNDAAYNNLADAFDILNGEENHPEILAQIEALMTEF